jgi:phosphoribosylaminoimidazole-succinocarboxamide synthase
MAVLAERQPGDDHRLWEAETEEERERLSKKNFYRFLDRWGKRTDLLVD